MMGADFALCKESPETSELPKEWGTITTALILHPDETCCRDCAIPSLEGYTSGIGMFDVTSI